MKTNNKNVIIENYSIVGKTLVNDIIINPDDAINFKIIEKECLIIGCHKITLDEMEDVIRRNNIDITNIKKE